MSLSLILRILDWYLPWSELDSPLKVMAVIWILSVLLGIGVFVWRIVLGRPWLTMKHMAAEPHTDKETKPK